MAATRWYLANTVTDGWQTLTEASQTAATTNAGWVVGTGLTNSSELASGAERASTTFVANTVPDGTLDTTLKDAFRTDALNGTFANADWIFRFAVQSPVQGGAADGQIMFRLIKADADGSNATLITASQMTAAIVSNVAAVDLFSTLQFNPGAIVFSNQHLFVQVAWKRTGAGGMTTTNIRLRTGTSATVGTTILSADFVAAPPTRLATLTQTLADATVSATGTSPYLDRLAEFAQPSENASLAATAVVPLLERSATLTQTLANATLVSTTGVLAVRSAALVQTTANATVLATVTTAHEAALSRTLANATLTATAQDLVGATLVRTLAPATLVATVGTGHGATVGVTLAPATLVAEALLIVESSAVSNETFMWLT